MKFVELNSFRELPPPVDVDEDDVLVGVVFSSVDGLWRIEGIVPHPNRPGDHLVFVRRISSAASG